MYKKRISSIASLSMSMVLTTGWATFLTNTAHAQDDARLLETAVHAPHRSDANRARDQYRHPKETLLFFGLQPDMTVVEISPANGWYSEIIAPFLKKQGQFYAAVPRLTDDMPEAMKRRDASYRQMLKVAP